MKIKKFNEKMDSLLEKTITDISELQENLEFLKKFIAKIPEEKSFEFYAKISTLHTDIQLLNRKVKPNKKTT